MKDFRRAQSEFHISLPKSGKDVSEIFLGMEKAYVQTRLVRKGRIRSALGKWKRRIYFQHYYGKDVSAIHFLSYVSLRFSMDFF